MSAVAGPSGCSGFVESMEAAVAGKAFDLSRLSLADYASARLRVEEMWLEWIAADGHKVIDIILEEACAKLPTPLNRDTIAKSKADSPPPSPPSSPLQPPRSPTRKAPKKRTQAEISPPLHNGVHIEQRAKSSSPHSGLHHECFPKPATMHIPTFYNPELGGTLHRRIKSDALQNRLQEIESYFKPYPQGIPMAEFGTVTRDLCGFPRFFDVQLCQRIAEMYDFQEKDRVIRGDMKVQLRPFVQFWKCEMEPFDKVERFFRILKKPDSSEITKDDFNLVLFQILNTHPGLEFLRSHEDFQRKYALTVITRIFYTANTSRSGRLSLRELRRSNIIREFHHVDKEEDINKVTSFFSYEHFYVLYCRFFELDADNDGRLSREDLMKHGEHALSEIIIDRVFRVGERAFSDGIHGDYDTTGMTYPDFIFFMLSEEDKSNPMALRYWFRCVDLDGDGVITAAEMSYFYRMQLHRVTSLGYESVRFEDMLCQMVDMIDPREPSEITLQDLTVADKLTSSGVLFDALFNLHKFVRFEMRDPFAEKKRRDDPFENDWDRFAYLEYHRLAAEEELEPEQSPSMEVEGDNQAAGKGNLGAGHDDLGVIWPEDTTSWGSD